MSKHLYINHHNDRYRLIQHVKRIYIYGLNTKKNSRGHVIFAKTGTDDDPAKAFFLSHNTRSLRNSLQYVLEVVGGHIGLYNSSCNTFEFI